MVKTQVKQAHLTFALNVLLVFFSYVGTYSVLSAYGTYRPRPSGEVRHAATGLATIDISLWCPSGTTWELRRSIKGDYVIDANLFGWAFLPLLWIDRECVHPTIHHL
jgi:hypothetical protein